MATKPKPRVFSTQDTLNIVKSGKIADATHYATSVQRLLISGDKTYSEYLTQIAEIKEQLRSKSSLVKLGDGHYLSRKEAENMRRFFNTWEQTRRDYERILAAYKDRIEEKP